MWTVKALAKRAMVTKGYIRRLLIEGEIDGEKFGVQWAIPAEEAKRWLSERGIDVEIDENHVWP